MAANVARITPPSSTDKRTAPARRSRPAVMNRGQIEALVRATGPLTAADREKLLERVVDMLFWNQDRLTAMDNHTIAQMARTITSRKGAR